MNLLSNQQSSDTRPDAVERRTRVSALQRPGYYNQAGYPSATAINPCALRTARPTANRFRSSREARSEKREARSEKREARSEKREARSEKREARIQTELTPSAFVAFLRSQVDCQLTTMSISYRMHPVKPDLNWFLITVSNISAREFSRTACSGSSRFEDRERRKLE